MIGIAMKSWPDDALRRVIDAPVEKWRPNWFAFADGAGCLLGHACNALAFSDGTWFGKDQTLHMDPDFDAVHEGLCGGWKESDRVQARFDRLCARFGLPRTVRACKARALRILLDRHPLDAKIAVLRATVEA